MKHYITATVLAAGMALGAGQAVAASLGLTTEAPNLSSSTAIIDYLEFAPDGDLSTFGAEVDFTDGVSPNGFTEVGFGIGFSLADPTTGLSGGFDIFDEDGFLLGGDLFAVGISEDVIELQFNNLSGSASGFFGNSVLTLISLEDALGLDPFASLEDGTTYEASISISNVAPIPLPTALTLLLSGLGALAFLTRKQRSKPFIFVG